MAFTYLKAKSAKCLCQYSGGLGFGLGLVSSGLGLGLKNLALFTSLLPGRKKFGESLAVLTQGRRGRWRDGHRFTVLRLV